MQSTCLYFFGIGETDSNARRPQTAADNGWATPQKAILGGTHFIGDKYIAVGQDTAYLQRFNIISACEKGIISHQYGSAIDMAIANCSQMTKFYENSDGTDMIYKIPAFKE